MMADIQTRLHRAELGLIIFLRHIKIAFKAAGSQRQDDGQNREGGYFHSIFASNMAICAILTQGIPT